MDNADDTSYTDETEGEMDHIACPRCAHINLAFRSHCRRCGAGLQASSGVMPFLELVEWSPTDGPEQRERARPRLTFLLAIAVALLAPLILIGIVGLLSSSGLSMALVTFLPAAILIGVISLALSRRGPPSEQPEEEEAVSQERLCPSCGEIVLPCDDVCAACGAVVAADLTPPATRR